MHSGTDSRWDSVYGKIPDDIPDGTIMATIKNFSMTISEK